ncbi:hypothetical protein ACFQ9X_50680 [Catenulispora yoronensis]
MHHRLGTTVVGRRLHRNDHPRIALKLCGGEAVGKVHDGAVGTGRNVVRVPAGDRDLRTLLQERGRDQPAGAAGAADHQVLAVGKRNVRGHAAIL